MIKTFRSDIYPIQFVLCYDTVIEEIVEGTYKWYAYGKSHLAEELEPLRESTAFAYENGGLIIISLPHKNYANWHGLVSYEVSHATFFVCERLGIDTTVSPQEAYCYLNGWITEKVYSLIEKDITKI